MSTDMKQAALDYHAKPTPGKISVELTTPAETQWDLSLAYSPGVAEPCREIARDPALAYEYTGKGNLVAVISNGTAVLGLGNLGPLASKPVMEGKALLFKRFAGINAIDIEVNTEDADEFIATVARIADTFGGMNLEDNKAPECFEIEAALVEQCSIPVFHDDQHGTAIVTAAGLLNALEIQGKRLEDVSITCLGAGAAAIACMRLLVSLGARRENLYMLDRRGVIYEGREGVNAYKQEFANHTDKRSLSDALKGADVFIGLSGANLMSAEYDASELAADADDKIRTFQADSAREANIFHHLITLPTYHTAALSTDNLAKEYFGDAGMLGYVAGVQRKEIRQGIACVKHQNMSGSDMGDDHKEYFAGENALKAGGAKNTSNQFN